MKNLLTLIESENIIKVILSSPNDKKNSIKKIIIKKITGENNFFVEEKYTKDKVYNYNNVDIINEISTNVLNFKQILILCPEFNYQCFVNKNGNIKILKKKNEKILNNITSLNNKKNYIFNEDMPIDAFVELGIFTKDYKIIKAKYDKFKQINKFIEFIDLKLKNKNIKKLKIIDFGCGKSYLTFFVYYYCNFIRKIDTEITGYDLKEDVVNQCNKIATKYNYNKLNFIVADITQEKEIFKDVDMIITLHACDTATDYALYYAIKNNVKYIFSVPCCQHEINNTISANNDLSIILKHGILKERLSAILTDAIRVELLKSNGYKTEISEYIDSNGSLKNLMIIAEKTGKTNQDYNCVKILQNKYLFSQTLLRLLEKKE